MSSFAAASSPPRLCVPDGIYYVVMHQEHAIEEPGDKGALAGWAADGASASNDTRPKPIVMDVDCGMKCVCILECVLARLCYFFFFHVCFF